MSKLTFYTSNAGGGGERVLWTAIRDVQKEFPNVICAVYTGDIEASKEQIINKVKVKNETISLSEMETKSIDDGFSNRMDLILILTQQDLHLYI